MSQYSTVNYGYITTATHSTSLNMNKLAQIWNNACHV